MDTEYFRFPAILTAEVDPDDGRAVVAVSVFAPEADFDAAYDEFFSLAEANGAGSDDWYVRVFTPDERHAGAAGRGDVLGVHHATYRSRRSG